MRRTGKLMVPPGYRDSPTRVLNPGEVVASAYTIRSEVARTETGIVYEAHDMLVDRLVALKLAWRDPGMPSLVTEARRCAQVRDPCAVAIHCVSNYQGIEYVVAERVTGTLLHDLLQVFLPAQAYLTKLRALFAAVARAHEYGVAVGDISGATILVDVDADKGDRMILGRLSMSQVPAFGPLGQILAPEVVRGEVAANDPVAAEAIDLYGLGCIAIELACGAPPFTSTDRDDQLRGHASHPPPRLANLRPDLSAELSDLVEWLLAKVPLGRPSSARDVLAQLDALALRTGTKTRSIRVLVVDDDTARSRWLWSLVRRAHAGAVVEIASDGTDAAHKLHRDKPDLLFIDAGLRGVMNALELCMYARGIDADPQPELVLIGDLPERDRAVLAAADVSSLPESHTLPNEVIECVRRLAAVPQRRTKPRTVSG
ncbi:MAG TPA: response regulator [Kofleriaceae bacterium]|nr:response regulator [Kofleriaceae bacterium]